jgi:hypothetical protein
MPNAKKRTIREVGPEPRATRLKYVFQEELVIMQLQLIQFFQADAGFSCEGGTEDGFVNAASSTETRFTNSTFEATIAMAASKSRFASSAVE